MRAHQHSINKDWKKTATLGYNRLIGLVVKVPTSRAEDPGFESRLRQDFFRVEPY